MLPGMEMLACPNLAVSSEVMQHIVQVESGANPFAIGVVGGQLARQPRNLDEALATARMLETNGYNFSLGIAQVNRSNLARYGLDSYSEAFDTCGNLAAGAKILAGCFASAHGDWGKAFSCYYSGNFTTGFRDGYVRKVYASINREAEATAASDGPVDQAIPLTVPNTRRTTSTVSALPQEVVHASDSPEYRKAIRSVAIDAAATAMLPLVISADGDHPHLETMSPIGAEAQQPAGNTANPVTPEASQASGDLQQTFVPKATNSGASGNALSTNNNVFEPLVRGPNDPTTQSAAVPQGSTRSRSDKADLRMEQRDALFVF